MNASYRAQSSSHGISERRIGKPQRRMHSGDVLYRGPKPLNAQGCTIYNEFGNDCRHSRTERRIVQFAPPGKQRRRALTRLRQRSQQRIARQSIASYRFALRNAACISLIFWRKPIKRA
jgi:hypothetical protein